MTAYKTYFNWSSGKDSALALYYLLQKDTHKIDLLLTTINSHYNRVSMHGLRTSLLTAQTKAIGIPSHLVELPEMPTMAIYKKKMQETLVQLKANGYTHGAFGDIFLEDLRTYRERQLAKQNIKAIFPIWKKETTLLLNTFLDVGFKTIVVCADSKYFDQDFVGTIIDKSFIEKLPEGVDPCGENGEFHTFCFDGPIFKNPIKFSIGEKLYREYKAPKTKKKDFKTKSYGVWYCDLILD